MYQLTTLGGDRLGPFAALSRGAGAFWEADGVILYDTVVGEGGVAEAWVGALPVASVVSPAPSTLELVRQIDADADAIYGAVLGNRGPEYTLAETEALAYQAAGYSGTVPASVASWVTAKSWTATQAADDILATATAWRNAMNLIRATRLSLKQAALGDEDARRAAKSQWDSFVAGIKTQLGITA